VFARPGVDIKGEVKLIPMDPMPISASEVRARARNGEDLAGLVPPAVANYIARRGLYC
jgi:nicotinate-nucleotide adenylyltransferase